MLTSLLNSNTNISIHNTRHWENIRGEWQYPSTANLSHHAKNISHKPPSHPCIHTGNPKLIGHSDTAWPGTQTVKVITYYQ